MRALVAVVAVGPLKTARARVPHHPRSHSRQSSRSLSFIERSNLANCTLHAILSHTQMPGRLRCQPSHRASAAFHLVHVVYSPVPSGGPRQRWRANTTSRQSGHTFTLHPTHRPKGPRVAGNTVWHCSHLLFFSFAIFAFIASIRALLRGPASLDAPGSIGEPRDSQSPNWGAAENAPAEAGASRVSAQKGLLTRTGEEDVAPREEGEGMGQTPGSHTANSDESSSPCNVSLPASIHSMQALALARPGPK